MTEYVKYCSLKQVTAVVGAKNKYKKKNTGLFPRENIMMTRQFYESYI